MSLTGWLNSIASRVFRRNELADEMEEELRAHIALRADDLQQSGISRAQAERRARIEFGARERYREESYAAMGGNLLDTFLNDLRYALRVLIKSPGFTLTAILTLALAIGANSVVFALLNALILRPINVPQPERFYTLDHVGSLQYFSYPEYLDLRDHNHTLAGIVVEGFGNAAVDTGSDPALTWLLKVSGNYFDVAGVQPFLGRFFGPADEHGPNSAPYAVLNYSYWHTHFHDDRGVIGATIRLNKHPFTIVGVAPPDFNGALTLFSPSLWVPIVNQEQVDGQPMLTERGHWIESADLRLKPGVTLRQAEADLNAIRLEENKAWPKFEQKEPYCLVRPGIGGNFIGPALTAFLSGLMLLSVLILLAACANLGSLFAARASDRSREVALRLALGARRLRILRGLFTEAILISLAGGAVGLAGSLALLRAITAWRPFPQFPMYIPVNPDARVYLVALFLALASGFLFGAVPVRQTLRTDPYQVVKNSSITAGAKAGRRISARDLLLVVQIAICAVLVTSSFVAVRGLVRSLHAHLGFDPQHVMLAEVNLAMAGYNNETGTAFERRMLDVMKSSPGVSSAALVSQPALHMGWDLSAVYSDGTADLRPANQAFASIAYNVSPGYFLTASTALLSGRDFTWNDDKNAPSVAIVNAEFARTLFGSAQNALGRHFKVGDGTRVEVVGIVEQGKYTANLAESPQPAMFRPLLQAPYLDIWLMVRSGSDPQQLAPAMRSALRNLDRSLPVFTQTWEVSMNGALFAPRMAAVSLGILGLMGAILSITGIFGMAAYSVSKRLKELGIRVALGARTSQVLSTALGRALQFLAVGSVAGLVLGILASRLLSFIVYQATPRDPLVLAGVVLAMALLGLIATWLPAQRALSVDPMSLLRED